MKIAETKSHLEKRREETRKGEKYRRKDIHAITVVVLRTLRITKQTRPWYVRTGKKSQRLRHYS